ncbi:MAG: hypothetical protein A2014_03525 [Spirochaetes bacterium GWF1_49_6]|nr:MAG: hypothetical protein A2014_03525 [Spirochaetes bacterium GWF1_49_6]
MKKSTSFWITIIVIAIAIILPLFLFFDSIFLGKAILGIDGNYTLRNIYRNALLNGSMSTWNSANWLGMNIGNFSTVLWIFFTKIFTLDISETLAYAVSISASIIFTYLLLKKLGAEWYAAVFGALTFSFAPHFISLVYAGHVGVVSLVPYPPMILYFFHIAFDRAKSGILKTVVSLILAGIAASMMIGNDPQRGMYIAVLIAVYTLFLIFRKTPQKPEVSIESVRTPGDIFLDFGKVGIFLGVALLSSAFTLSGLLGSTAFQGKQAGVTAEETVESEAQKWDFATQWSMDPRELLDNLAFGYHGTISGDPQMPYWGTKPYSGNSESVGYFVMIFAIFGIVFGFKRKDFTTKFFFWGGMVALLLSFGKWLPGSPLFWLWYHIPMMDKLRAPAKFISVFALSFSIIAAFGFQWALEAIRKYKKPEDARDAKKTVQTPERKHFNIVMYFIITILVIGFLWMIGVMMSGTGIIASLGKAQYDNMVGALLRMNIYSALTLAVFYAAWSFRKESAVKLVYTIPFAVFLLFEAWSINLFFISKSYITPSEFFQKDGVVDFLTKDTSQYRVMTSMKFYLNGQLAPIPVTIVRGQYLTYIFPYYNIEAMDVPAMSRVDEDYDAFFKAILTPPAGTAVQSLDDLINLNVRLLQIANVKYLITDGNFYMGQQPQVIVYALTNNTNFSYIGSALGAYNRTHYIFAVKNTLPRIGLFTSYIAVTNNNDALQYLANSEFDFHKLAVVQGGFPDNSTNIARVIPQTVTEYKQWYIKCEVVSNHGGILMNDMRYDPTWKVYVNGKPAELLKVDYIMQGVKLEPGDCTVEFKYEPKTGYLSISLAMIWGGLIAGAIYGIIYLIGYLRRKDDEGDARG